jgi:hypothetical protein
MGTVAQRSFAGGEIAPALYARTDLAKYATGARTCRNMIVQRHGGATNRPGRLHRGREGFAVACRLIPSCSTRPTSPTRTARIRKRLYPVLSGRRARRRRRRGLGEHDRVRGRRSRRTWASTTTAGPRTRRRRPPIARRRRGVADEVVRAHRDDLRDPDAVHDGGSRRPEFVQSGDVITIVHPATTRRASSRGSAIRLDARGDRFGPVDRRADERGRRPAARPARSAIGRSRRSRRARSRNRSRACTARSTSSRRPATPTHRRGIGGGRDLVQRVPVDRWPDVRPDQLGRRQPDPSSDTAGGLDETVHTSSDRWTWVGAAAGQVRNPLAAISATVRAYDGNYTIAGDFTLSATGGVGVRLRTRRVRRLLLARRRAARARRPRIRFTRRGRRRARRARSRLLDHDQRARQRLHDADDRHRARSARRRSLGSRPSHERPFRRAEQSVSWYTGARAASPTTATRRTIRSRLRRSRALFDVAGDYPRGRVLPAAPLFGNTANEPETVRARAPAAKSLRDLDAAAGRRRPSRSRSPAKQVNAVKHLLDLGALVVFGTGRELVEGDDAGILHPDAINPRKLSTHGSRRAPPIEIDDSAIYVQGRGSLVRDLKPIGLDGLQGTDLTVFAAHLFEGYTLVDWAYARSRTRSSGPCGATARCSGSPTCASRRLGLAPARHRRGDRERVRRAGRRRRRGLSRRRRTINGATVRYVERMASRYFTTSSTRSSWTAALSYDGWHTGVTTMQLSGGDLGRRRAAHVTASAAAPSCRQRRRRRLPRGRRRQPRPAHDRGVHVGDRRPGPRGPTVPAALQAAIGNGSGAGRLRSTRVTGLAHLEGEDGQRSSATATSSRARTTPTYDDAVVVAGGSVTLDRPYAVIHVGLPVHQRPRDARHRLAGMRDDQGQEHAHQRRSASTSRRRAASGSARPDKAER